MKRITHVVTMGTAECAAELGLMLQSLITFNPGLNVTIGTSSELLRIMEQSDDLENGSAATAAQRSVSALRRLVQQPTEGLSSLRLVPCLDKYGKINRRSMESTPGVWYPSMHCDFMMEKANLMESALMHGAEGALFLDCDITTFAELPSLPEDTAVGLSPHGIREFDTNLFGFYNGGWVYMADPEAIFQWKKATVNSRYFDQASLEDVAAWADRERGGAPAKLFHFPQECNVGYWRVFQNDVSPIEATSDIRIPLSKPDYKNASADAPLRTLQSVHTHFHMPVADRAVPLFNRLIKRWARDTPVIAPIVPLL